MSEDYVTEYANKVLSGEIIASKAVIDACHRHLNDLKKQDNEDFDYFFDVDESNKIIDFLEILPDVKTYKTFPLGLFQKFIVGSIYGWREKDEPENRKYKKAFITMSRKGGKSILVAGIALYEFLFGKNPKMSRQIFCTANDKAQAKIVFNMIAKQLSALQLADDWVKKATKRVREEIKNLDDWSYIRPLSRDTGSVDGFEPYVGILDEYAASKTNEMMELLESGQGQLENPLIFIISTAGFDMVSPMRQQEYPYAKKILAGEVDDPSYFAYIAEQDSLAEVEDERTWVKSNPILDVPDKHDVMLAYLRKRKKEAQEKGNLNAVLVKNFNIWRQATESSYMDSATWENAKSDYPINIDGKKIWFGVDVGRTSDLFAISWLVPVDDEDNDKQYWYADNFDFVATKYGLDKKIKSDRLDYRRLEQLGQCEITTLESGVIDTDRVYEWLDNFVYEHNLDVQAVCFDPAQYGTLLALIEKNHPEWQQIQIQQGWKTLNMPTKTFVDACLDGQIRHSGNELLTAAINNAVLKVDNNGARIDKNKYANKIDPIDALLDCWAICYTTDLDMKLTDDYVMSDDFGF